ncbi:hypothetical protein [Aliarcobacter cryaerophilus]|uniref:hypothetical protein n=1 Tax=Aliarcobacter cryaerophilus TaxID=28198 RepID=UPI0021B684FC|nr:hypothetical protein [Aliarcobacter cryaerophilus]MCT7530430.1 hypothetical protein [Aliarcobacter cryaerophilus]
MRYILAIVASIGILIVFTVIKVFYSTMIDNYKKEHINELSKELYVALGVSELVPLIIAIILIRIVWKKITYKGKLETNSNLKSNSLESKDTINNSNPSLVKAVYNHTKDIASEIKPTIDEYKEKHQLNKSDTSNISSIDEDEIYEKVLQEIEEDNKVKSTWARALSQSDGNKDKAESLYIKLRFNEIQDDNLRNKAVIDIVTSSANKDKSNDEEFKLSSNKKINKNIKILIGTLFIILLFVILTIIIKFEKDFTYDHFVENNNSEVNKEKFDTKELLDIETNKNHLNNELKKYVIDYIDKTNKGYLFKVEELYANDIKSFSDISYPKNKVFKEKEKYLKRWNIVQTRLNNIESIDIENKTGNYIIKYNINFLVYNTNDLKGIKGEALNTFILNSDMKIIEEQQNIISKINFTDPNELIDTFFEQIVHTSNYENIGSSKIIISNYKVNEGEFPLSLLITKYNNNNNKNLVFYESGFYIDSFKYLDKNKILLRLSNTTIEKNYIFNVKNNSKIFLGNSSKIEIINNGEYNGFLKLSGIKTYLTRENGASEGTYWFDAIKNLDGKFIKLISKNSTKCIPVKNLIKEEDTSYLQQSLNDCIFVDY